ncbi:MAG: hypothetical protein GTO03_01980 [Planctomycetales bacterium]|nr:hypothetical protein [Planctomycetales bacterium]
MDIARAVAAADDHQLTSLSIEPGREEEARQLVGQLGDAAPPVTTGADGLTRLWQSRPDCLVLAAGDDPRAVLDNVRRLVELERPLVLAHPLHPSAMVYYELELVRESGPAMLVPYLPFRWHPAVRQLADGARAEEAAAGGPLEQITLDRSVGQLTRSGWLDLFAGDVDVVRLLAGDITDVAAMLGAAPDEAPTSLNVQMTTRRGVLVRWSLTAVEQPPAGQLTLVGRRGSLTLSLGATQPWQLEAVAGQRQLLETWPAPDGQQRLAALVAVLQQLKTDPALSQRLWQDATRDVEVVEALEKSLRKRRLVQLNYEGRGEQEAFKGTMVSLGCGLLVVLVMIAVAAGAALKLAKEQGLDQLAAWVAKLPYLALGVMVLFLLLQLLRLVIPVKRE